MRVCCFIALLTVSLAVPAQTAYRCTEDSGTVVFSQQPCGEQAQALTLQESRPGLPNHAITQIAVQSAIRNIELQEASCLRAAADAILVPAQRRINEYQSRIERLNAEIRKTRANLVGATWINGLREEIASLRASSLAERSAADAAYNAARERCVRYREQALKEIR